MELTEGNLKALQQKVQELRLKIEKLETYHFLIESERMKRNAYIQQLKQANRDLSRKVNEAREKIDELEDQIEQDNINAIEASEYD